MIAMYFAQNPAFFVNRDDLCKLELCIPDFLFGMAMDFSCALVRKHWRDQTHGHRKYHRFFIGYHSAA